MVVVCDAESKRTMVVINASGNKNPNDLPPHELTMMIETRERIGKDNYVIFRSEKNDLSEIMLYHWCRENIDNDCCIFFSTTTDEPNDNNMQGYFVQEEDAMAFKLRWME